MICLSDSPSRIAFRQLYAQYFDPAPRASTSIPPLDKAADSHPSMLYGHIPIRGGATYAGRLRWGGDQEAFSDTLDGRTADGKSGLRFDTIRPIARLSNMSSLVTLNDRRKIVLSGTPEAGRGNLGVYVDDLRDGRVLVSWNTSERLVFSPGRGGPAYSDFPPDCPLTGVVTTRAGRRFAGRLVYDLDVRAG